MLNALATLILAGTIYANAGTVTNVIQGGALANDVVTVHTAIGDYVMLADDLLIGDAVALVTYDNGTPNDVRDDIVISARYVTF